MTQTETQIKSFTELKAGDLVLIDNPMTKDDLAIVSTIIDTYKYPITEQSGRKLYFKDRKAYYADKCGDTGNEMIKEWGISSTTAGEYTFREDDTPVWNIRLISKDHQRYDKKLASQGKMMGSMFDMFSNFL